MNKRGGDPGPVPNRWLQCPRKSTELIANKFIACKTPLSSAFDDKVALKYRFHPNMLFDLCKSKKIKIGLWFDLTNTNRFYDKSIVENASCRYVKLQCPGHGETPTSDQTKIFIQLVHTFIANQPLESIAVHCTHGFNRTGFLIVSYLVEKMDCSIEVALDMFAKARPPGIYKQDYLEELYRRYDDIIDTPSAPELPDWCYNDGIQNEKDSRYSESGSSSWQSEDRDPPRKKCKLDTSNKRPTFMEGVPGVTHFTEQPKAHDLQKKVHTMCKWTSKGFPGSQPISMDKANMYSLQKNPYRVSWKADGTRYMMLIDGENEVYFFDRDYCIFKVEGLRFPHRKKPWHLRDTLIDGEMVIDKVNGDDIPRYLAYDIIVFEGKEVGEMPFYPTRLQCIENEIIKPRHVAMEHGLINKAAEPFSVRKKDFWDVTQAANLLGEKFARTLSHEPDGLIFQPAKEPYKPGRCDSVLKWKPAVLNSVDFKLKIVISQKKGVIRSKVGHLYVGQLGTPFGYIKYTKELKDLNNKIIECKFHDNQWKFMRERTDKSFPNAHTTALAVCKTITNPVTKELLLDFIDRKRFVDDHEIVPPPPRR